MIRFAIKISILVFVVIASLSALQYLSGSARVECEYNKRNAALQGPINLRLRFVDQNGATVPHYRFRVAEFGVCWFWRIFPATSNFVKYYSLETDDSGAACFNPVFSGYGVVVCEVDNSRYDAARDESGRPTWPAVQISPNGRPPAKEYSWQPDPGPDRYWVSSGSKAPQDVLLDLIKHDPPDQLQYISESFPLDPLKNRPDQLHGNPESYPHYGSVDMQPSAPDNVVIPIKMVRTDGTYREYWFNLKLTVIGAKAYALVLRDRDSKPIGRRQALPPLQLALETEEGYGLCLANTGWNNAPTAPENGYVPRVTAPVGEIGPGGRTLLVCFAKRENPPAYYRLAFEFTLFGGRDGASLGLNVTGLFNPSGSRNLYQTYPADITPRYRFMGSRGE